MEPESKSKWMEFHGHVHRQLGRHASAIAWSALTQWIFGAVFGYVVVVAKQIDVVIFGVILLLLSGLVIHAFQASCIARVRALSRVSTLLDARLASDVGLRLDAPPSVSPTAIVWVSSVLLLFLQILGPAAWLLCRSNHADACAIALPLLACALGTYLYVVRTATSGAARDLQTSTEWIEEVPGPT